MSIKPRNIYTALTVRVLLCLEIITFPHRSLGVVFKQHLRGGFKEAPGITQFNQWLSTSRSYNHGVIKRNYRLFTRNKVGLRSFDWKKWTWKSATHSSADLLPSFRLKNCVAQWDLTLSSTKICQQIIWSEFHFGPWRPILLKLINYMDKYFKSPSIFYREYHSPQSHLVLKYTLFKF